MEPAHVPSALVAFKHCRSELEGLQDMMRAFESERENVGNDTAVYGNLISAVNEARYRLITVPRVGRR